MFIAFMVFDADQSSCLRAYVKLWDGSKLLLAVVCCCCLIEGGGGSGRDGRAGRGSKRWGRDVTDTILAVLDEIEVGLAARLDECEPGHEASVHMRENKLSDLRMLRCLVLLWSGQSAALSSENEDVRQWVMGRLPAVIERLDRIDAKIARFVTHSAVTHNIVDMVAGRTVSVGNVGNNLGIRDRRGARYAKAMSSGLPDDTNVACFHKK
ncbi:hypothetical protein [Thalassospira alkalitolerans]|uniref:hypothetical protein n=1 Tax=Thalassospira alkalitolerans TaxID=1293890 RepID=UPI003AA9316D